MATTLVLLPGLGSTAAAFRTSKLYDIPGVRVQARDYGPAANANIQAMAASAWSQISAKTVVLLGYSMGGFVAQEMVCQQPARVSGVILVSTTAPTLAQVYADRRELRHFLDLLLTGAPGGNLNPQLLHADTYLKSLSSSVRKRMAAQNAHNALPVDQFLVQLSAVVSLMTSGTAPSRLRCFSKVPVLVIHGSEDVLIPPRAVAALDALQSFGAPYELREIPGAGHALLVEQPAVANAYIRDWLTRFRL